MNFGIFRGATDTTQIGDGKLPNKYWVSVSSDFYFFNPDTGGMDWASDRTPEVKTEGKTIAVFETYAKARQFFDDIALGEEHEGITVNHKSIEDRLSGEIVSETMREEVHLVSDGVTEDLKFTQETMRKRGAKFEGRR